MIGYIYIYTVYKNNACKKYVHLIFVNSEENQTLSQINGALECFLESAIQNTEINNYLQVLNKPFNWNKQLLVKNKIDNYIKDEDI